MLEKVFRSLNKVNQAMSTVDMVQGTASRVGSQAGRFSGAKKGWALAIVVLVIVLYLIFG